MKKCCKETAVKTKIIFMLMFFFMFMTGFYMIDIGASMKILETSIGLKINAEGLILVGVEPRLIYHTGLLFAMLSFVLMCLLFIYELDVA